ncbi:Hypothetical predicted protein [Olea europaea subsp. europaea]|uniref:DIX domain-containing protein n=1 Tax=Olea europaea subsp. europaea TaxID=158383 RepID=A0A8S0VHE3_OLEEU|nr:Hypothetical predicted protein [Olea europaea subsp. europaea]
MEIPKNYSNVYNEETAPVPASRSIHSLNSTKGRMDGECLWRRRRETGGGIDLNELLPKLQNLSKEQHKSYADSTLRQHYNDIFQKPKARSTYKVGIEYMENGQHKDRYLVKVERNTLEDVKAKLPIKGNYRLFFTHAGNECEEIEDDKSSVPVQRRNNEFYIHCRVFKK